jgi:serine/threonine protein kinase
MLLSQNFTNRINNILHRDLKPANLLTDENMRVKVSIVLILLEKARILFCKIGGFAIVGDRLWIQSIEG